ncbi:MAG: PA0069 family radical SAM protein [Thermoguttaceae bacterium]|nr:PA0069 family radical SAM protein [Thermoguttaceae bacterium]MDW8038764.1 PA0069 family radical SAM protein [Thermoguttaceae bacterium]
MNPAFRSHSEHFLDSGRRLGRQGPRGRGAAINPPNRYERFHHQADYEQLQYDEDFWAAQENPQTEYIPDQSQSIVTSNDSPDIPYRYTLNPYRGCSHGCAYCYARPTHEYLGLSAGLDFETKIIYKPKAAELFREFLSQPGWEAEPICLSGVTDCYQPAERRFRLTRACLEVALEARQPVSLVTKNALILRDVDLLSQLARHRLVHVSISITTLDAELARRMEPRTSPPEHRLRAVRQLSEAGVPVGVLVAPVVPGLTDSEIPRILRAAAQAGARCACFQLVRLPLTVKPVFLDWLQRNFPLRRRKIENLIRSTHEGRLNSPEFCLRLSGSGPLAEQIAQLFDTFAHKYGLNGGCRPLDSSQFRPPRRAGGQMWLF